MDPFTQFTQGLDQLGTALRQVEEWGLEHHTRMVGQGWSEETATEVVVDRIKLMQSLIISMGASR